MITLDQAVQQMRAAGLPALPDGHPRTDGRIWRFGPGKKSWYVLHEIRRANGSWSVHGAYGTWQGTNNYSTKIEADWTEISDHERAELERRQREQDARERERQQERAKYASNRARQQWMEASSVGESLYALRKQITTPGLRFLADGTLLVPMLKHVGDGLDLVGLQKIAEDGSKTFNKGMAKAGAFCPIGKAGPDEKVLFIAEGYATARSVRMALKDTVAGFVAFDAGNLLPVLQGVRARHPDAHILICADDDFAFEPRVSRDLSQQYGIDGVVIDGQQRVHPGTDGEYQVTASWCQGIGELGFIEVRVAGDGFTRTLRYENTGLVKAHEAAQAIGNASVVVPEFADRGENKWTDWNDLHCVEGLEACAQQLEAAVLCALTPPVVKAAQAEKELARSVAAPAANTAAAEKVIRSETGPMEAEHENSELTWEARLSNVVDILEFSPDWAGVIVYDEFSGQVVKAKAPPFPRGEIGEWTDKDDLRATLWIQRKYSFHPREDVVMKGVLLAADAQSRHVVRDYLDPLVWDGKERLSMWMIDYLGAEDIEYVRRVSRKFMIGAVARIYKPGCKMDNVLILEGTQGLKKSTALKTLAGEWFTDAPLRFENKDTYSIMRGKWIIELAELDSFNKADSEAAKQFFGQYVDRYRDFYGKRASDVPRQQVFAGSTNKYVYLKDETGNRRYWPVRAIEIYLEALAAARDQLWAEAVVAFRAGEPYWETPDDVPLFREQQEARFVSDAYTEVIAVGLIGKTQTSVTDVLQNILKLDTSKWTMPEQQRVGRSLGQLGWIRKKGPSKGGDRPWIYVRGDGEAVSSSGQEEEAGDAPI
ncbi:VapE domain-containing protein [Herbaspirillum huttiense]|uniref:VapE domain-containing protein n=1 Tax=Herbaspirillum huttiense TaxID=863372 RepID=UPI0005856F4E|nr:VapE domain-containing protein [Herbaspirillum huttiense]